MKKILLVTGIALSQLAISQTQRFIYQVTMKPEKADKTKVKTENAYLDTSPEGSVFVSENRIKRDSLMQSMRTSGNFDRSQMQNLRSSINYIVKKDLKNQKVSYSERIGRDLYSYDEDRKINWTILPETAKIGDYRTQKAQTTFAGRTWNAWFTTDVPLQDGPYKFSGLPGLIVKVEDHDGDYSFDLREAKKITEPAAVNDRGQIVKVKRTDFEKQQARFTKDPMSFFSSNTSAPAPPSSGSGRGGMRAMDPQRMKEMEARLKDEINKNNNPIELP